MTMMGAEGHVQLKTHNFADTEKGWKGGEQQRHFATENMPNLTRALIKVW